MNLATQTNPFDPQWHLHYANVLSKGGESALKDGKREHAKVLFRVVERELMTAGKLFKDKGQANQFFVRSAQRLVARSQKLFVSFGNQRIFFQYIYRCSHSLKIRNSFDSIM